MEATVAASSAIRADASLKVAPVLAPPRVRSFAAPIFALRVNPVAVLRVASADLPVDPALRSCAQPAAVVTNPLVTPARPIPSALQAYSAATRAALRGAPINARRSSMESVRCIRDRGRGLAFLGVTARARSVHSVASRGRQRRTSLGGVGHQSSLQLVHAGSRE